MILEAEAQVIRRIFQEYASGRAPREIAHDLNKERVSAPRGRAWNASTINGNLERAAGILQNELYVGRLVWNKVRMVKDPDTGKRLSRPNSRSDWQVAEVPYLAIVDPKLFTAAQQRKEERSRTHPSHQRRPRRMLSGLLRCGSCGSGMATSVAARDAEAAEAIRDLVDTITVFRDPPRPGGVAVEIAGRLNALLGEATNPNRVTGVWGKMVAGEGYRLSPHVVNLRYFIATLLPIGKPAPGRCSDSSFQTADTPSHSRG